MPAPGAAISTRHDNAPFVRDGVPADYPAIREVVIAAYRQYADLMEPDTFSFYLANLLDLDTHARHGRLLVVEADERVRGFASFYPDASVQGYGLPRGWASGRAMAVDPAARGLGIARTLIATLERLAHDSGAPVFAFHTASFMTGAIALYDRLGYHRAPEFDFDWTAHYGLSGAAPITWIAYLRHLTRVHGHVDGARHARGPAKPVHPKQTNHRSHNLEEAMTTHTHAHTRRASMPAYYLGRPAARWLAALAPQSTTRTSPRVSRDSKPRCSSPTNT